MYPNYSVSVVKCLGVGSLIAVFISVDLAEASVYRLKRQTVGKKPLKGGVCVIPEALPNGKYRPSEKRCPPDDTTPACQMLPGAFVPPDWVLYYDCDAGYVLDTTKTVAVCVKGQWRPSLPVCNKFCPPLRSQSLDLNCTFGGSKVSCDQPVRPGTVATQQCKEYYHPAYEAESDRITCLNSGLWNYPLPYCTPDDICKQDGSTLWACKKINQCPKAQENLKKRIIPDTCYVSNKDPYICCEPKADTRIVDPAPQKESKSVQMCKEYAKTVFKSTPKQDGDGEETIDTCSFVEPVDAPVLEDSDGIPELPSSARPREFPHIAVIGYGEKSSKRPDVRCVGSLISEQFVLSVASCSSTPIGPAAWVRLGDYNVNSDTDEGEGNSRAVIHDIGQRFNHPDYEKSTNPNHIVYNDIALFKLKTSVKFNEFIRPICLHTGEQFSKTFAIITGWGPVELGERPSNILQKANLTIVDNKECSDAYKFHGQVTEGLDTQLVLCAALVDGRDTCMSLPGSPLQIRTRDPYCMYSLAGVAAFGRACFVKSPAVYNRISHYLEWIENIVWS